MLYAKKGNKVLRITELTKSQYATQGFTIYEDGKIVEYGRGVTVSMADYQKLAEENEKLKAQLRELTQKSVKATEEVKAKPRAKK